MFLNFLPKSRMAHSYAQSLVATLLICMFFEANAQISTPCTSSMINSFSPCLNYVTGSSASGSSPTHDCCNSLESLVSGSMDCACLIITGNVPVSVPFVNRSLAISLPRVCKTSVPLKCKASGDPLPAPGPVLFGPSAAPAAASTHGSSPISILSIINLSYVKNGHLKQWIHFLVSASKAAAADAPPPADTLDISPASPPEFSLAPNANPGIRPVVDPRSDSNLSTASLPYLVLIFIGMVVFKF
ncbi:non-specific lipid transfer protein GPI-anchored 16-like isoform X1 [Primulina eburnea]|uniref:non-specific lipid transfer protein GPI-anchored 16-like isoform X1 n=1 Tax=Primulina eburnea TaxID=1245227 RepID=UPI003C6CAAC6